MAEILTRNCNNKPVEKNRSPYKDYYMSEIRFRKLNQKGDTIDMKRTLNIALSVLSLAGIFAQPLQAGVATPSAAFTVTLANGNNFIATPFARSEEGIGTITGQAGNVLTVSPISGPLSYAAGAYGPSAAQPHVLEILDGNWIGYSAPISNNTANTITLPAGAPSDLNGAKYAIREDWTVESLFGAAATSVLTATDLDAGDDIESADQIRLMNDNGTLGPIYFRAKFEGSYGWFNENAENVANTRLPFGKGVFIKSTGSKSLLLSGIVRASRTRFDIIGGKKINLLANPVPFPVKLSESGMDITPGSSSGSADNLRLWSGTSWVTYWRNTSGRWTVGSSTDASSVNIPAGAGFLIKRNSNRGDLKGESALKFTASAVAP
jgi:hypothetical protein